jgi:hypothetical protein
VLQALNVFFREAGGKGGPTDRLFRDDFHGRDTTTPVRIVLTFSDLSEEAALDFKHYFRNGVLKVATVAVFNDQLGQADLKQVGYRLVMEDFRGFFEAAESGGKVDDLRAAYSGYRNSYPELPAVKVRAEMESALRSYESSHPELCTEVESSAQFYGFSKGDNLLAK